MKGDDLFLGSIVGVVVALGIRAQIGQPLLWGIWVPLLGLVVAYTIAQQIAKRQTKEEVEW